MTFYQNSLIQRDIITGFPMDTSKWSRFLCTVFL